MNMRISECNLVDICFIPNDSKMQNIADYSNARRIRRIDSSDIVV